LEAQFLKILKKNFCWNFKIKIISKQKNTIKYIKSVPKQLKTTQGQKFKQQQKNKKEKNLMIWPKLFFPSPLFLFIFTHIYSLFRVLIYACLSLPLKFFFHFSYLSLNIFFCCTQSVFFVILL